MKNIIVGTAGHVDHGKTTLIKALTGIDTDRLKEEKERGLTIDLGFASLALPNGQVVGIVDVPGHERFIKNMLAGAGGVDVALLVIAADESVMPQTVEHLEILELLEVRRGVVALTKADTVDADWLEVVKEDVSQSLSHTFLADAPIVPVASLTGDGIPELLAAIQEACDSIEARDPSGTFRLPIDRAFTLTGFGTVVTGTLISGTVKVGDTVEILPKGLESRVRQIQVYGSKADSASAGSRVALNLSGVGLEDIQRGDVCAPPGALKASSIFDLKLNMLADAPRTLRNRARVRLHVGTAELIGRIVLLDRDELEPGGQTFAQFQSESPSAAVRGDRFIIRAYSPMRTIGGGVIVDPTARKHKRFDEGTLDALETRSQGSPEELLEQALKQAPTGTTLAELSKSFDDAQTLVAGLKESGRAVELEGGRLFHASVLVRYSEKAVESLTQFHSRNPLKPGMPKEELRGGPGKGLDSRTFGALLAHLEANGVVKTTETLASLPDFDVRLIPQQQKAAEGISAELEKAGFNVPSRDELVQGTGLPPATARDILDLLAWRGEIVKVADDLYFHASAMEKAETMVREHLQSNGSITVSQFRDLTGSSRKYAVPLLEHFDSKRITRRIGDERVLVGK